MGVLFSLIGALAGIGNLICLILVLIKLFPAEGPLKGILGIFCGIYTFVWGWMNADQYGIRNIMKIWTACFAASIIFQILGVAMTNQ
jgi:hypothetical protein